MEYAGKGESKLIVPIVISLSPTSNNKKYMWNYIKSISFCKEYGCPLITQESYSKGVLEEEGFFADNLCEHFEYETVTQEILEELEIYVVPQEVIKRYIDSYPSQTDAYLSSIRCAWPEMEHVFTSIIEEIESTHGKIEAFLLLENSGFVNEVAEKHGIKVIHFEWGPFRPSAYRKSMYFDFDDIVTGLKERYCRFVGENKMELPVLSNEEILSIFLEDDYMDYIHFRQRKPKYEYGVALPSTNIEPCCAYNMVTSEEMKTRINAVCESTQVCWRPHPFDKSMENEANVQLSKHHSAIDFILDCKRIVSASSNIAYETMLLDRVSYDLGYSHYAFKGNSSFDEGKEHKPELLFLNYVAFAYLVPYELVHNEKYISYRLTNPSESELYLFHLNYYLATLGLTSESLSDGNLLDRILEARREYYEGSKTDYIEIDYFDKEIQREIEGFVSKKREKNRVKNENAELKKAIEALQNEIEQYRKNTEMLVENAEVLANENMELQKQLAEKADVWDDVMCTIPAIERMKCKLIQDKNDKMCIEDIDNLLSYYESYQGKRINYMYVYYDIGNGINEEDKIRAEYLVEGNKYFARCVLPENSKMIRIDLCEDGEKLLYFDNLKINGEKDRYEEYNVQIVGGKHTFIGQYPYMILKDLCREIEVEFELYSLYQ